MVSIAAVLTVVVTAAEVAGIALSLEAAGDTQLIMAEAVKEALEVAVSVAASSFEESVATLRTIGTSKTVRLLAATASVAEFGGVASVVVVVVAGDISAGRCADEHATVIAAHVSACTDGAGKSADEETSTDGGGMHVRVDAAEDNMATWMSVGASMTEATGVSMVVTG